MQHSFSIAFQAFRFVGFVFMVQNPLLQLDRHGTENTKVFV